MNNNTINIHPLWYICITIRSIIFISPLIYYFFFKKDRNKELINKISRINKYILLVMGFGFLYKTLSGSNNEIQINKVFWHRTRIIHSFLYILAGINFHNYKLSSFLLFSDVLFSIIYRYLNGHFNN